MSNFRKALIITAIPIVILAIISAAGMAVEQPHDLESVFTGVWVVDGVLWVVGLIICIVFTIIRQRQIATGILAGLGIGIVALGLSCLANMQTGL